MYGNKRENIKEGGKCISKEEKTYVARRNNIYMEAERAYKERRKNI